MEERQLVSCPRNGSINDSVNVAFYYLPNENQNT